MTLLRVAAAIVVVVLVLFATRALDRRGTPAIERGRAGASSGEGAGVAAADRELLAASVAPPPAGDSLLAIPGRFTDAEGRARRLAEFRGAPFLASLIYTRCPTVCPRVVAELQRVERSPAGAGTRFVLFSLDPEYDTPEVMRAFAEAHALDPARWTLLAPGPEALPALGRALGVARADDPGGGIAHSAVIAVVDRDGRVRQRHVGLEPATEVLLAELRAAR